MRPMALMALLALPGAAQESTWASGRDAFSAAGSFRIAPFARPAPAPRTPAAPPQPPRVCSGLDFSGITWPSGLALEDQLSFATALNISGSFEGSDGWNNITDDFDGQGVSLGLLNQNLGQGSLQPLLVAMRERHPDVLQSVFVPDHLQSLLGMLGKWQPPPARDPSLPPPDPQSTIDEHPDAQVLMSPEAAAGVAWAKRTLYVNGAFDPVWKSELMTMAATPQYVSLQVAAAGDLHAQAVSDEKRLDLKELRAYLMLFDVAVQNGGLYDQDVKDYLAWARKNPSAGTARRLDKVLQLRLRHVRRRFIADVNSRKTAIINGKGRVHGEGRDLPAQYCYDSAWPYKL